MSARIYQGGSRLRGGGRRERTETEREETPQLVIMTDGGGMVCLALTSTHFQLVRVSV
jgi:hypothetical protein